MIDRSFCAFHISNSQESMKFGVARLTVNGAFRLIRRTRILSTIGGRELL